jgi:hypothetical protein
MGKQNNALSGNQTIDRQLISEDDTFLWLSRGDLKGETGREIMAEEGKAR